MITVRRLNYRVIEFSLHDYANNNNPMSIDVGDEVVFTVKENLRDSDANVRIRKDISGGGIKVTDGQHGRGEIELTVGDLSLPASDYHADLFLVKPFGVQYSTEPMIFRVGDSVPADNVMVVGVAT